jgi:HD-GYP domain-containing protein (c-di-GMP phosphodiesterase class II)
VTRDEGTEVLADEKDFLVAYARTVGVAIQQIVLGENLEENLIDTIAAFVNALESKDPYLKGHSARVSLYAGEIARALGLSTAQVGLVRRAGILHDLGKLVVMEAAPVPRRGGGGDQAASRAVRRQRVPGRPPG